MPRDVLAPHDALFQWTFSDPARAAVELKAVLPPVVLGLVDLSSLRPARSLSIGKDLSRRQCDVLFSAKIGAKTGYIFFLLEHQSSVDPLMAFRVLEYVVRLLARHVESAGKPQLPLPVVLPIVVHHSESGWTASRRLVELFPAELAAVPELRAHLPAFTFLLDDISRASDAELMARATAESEHFVAVALWALRDGRSAQHIMASFHNWVTLLRRVAQSEERKDALIALISYLSHARAELSQDQIETIVEAAAPEAKETLMTYAEELKRQGHAQGMQQGMQQGVQQGVRETLERLLRLKFGDLAPVHHERLESASPPDLHTWTERVLTAESLDDVFG